MTDKQWTDALAEIDSLRFQLVNNIMPKVKRRDLTAQLVTRLRNLAEFISQGAATP